MIIFDVEISVDRVVVVYSSEFEFENCTLSNDKTKLLVNVEIREDFSSEDDKLFWKLLKSA